MQKRSVKFFEFNITFVLIIYNILRLKTYYEVYMQHLKPHNNYK